MKIFTNNNTFCQSSTHISPKFDSVLRLETVEPEWLHWLAPGSIVGQQEVVLMLDLEHEDDLFLQVWIVQMIKRENYPFRLERQNQTYQKLVINSIKWNNIFLQDFFLLCAYFWTYKSVLVSARAGPFGTRHVGMHVSCPAEDQSALRDGRFPVSKYSRSSLYIAGHLLPPRYIKKPRNQSYLSTRQALEDWFHLALTIRKSWGRCPPDSPTNEFTTLCLVHQDILPRNLILFPSGQPG